MSHIVVKHSWTTVFSTVLSTVSRLEIKFDLETAKSERREMSMKNNYTFAVFAQGELRYFTYQ